MRIKSMNSEYKGRYLKQVGNRLGLLTYLTYSSKRSDHIGSRGEGRGRDSKTSFFLSSLVTEYVARNVKKKKKIGDCG